jgi:hypothetical protein
MLGVTFSIVMLSVIILGVIFAIVMLSVIILGVKFSIVMLTSVMLGFGILSVLMLNVVAQISIGAFFTRAPSNSCKYCYLLIVLKTL